MKKCKSCLQEKSLDLFYNRSDRRDRKRSICIDCHLSRRKSKYASDSENEEYRKNHAKGTHNWRVKNIEKSMFIRAKSRSKNGSIEFNIELSDIIIPMFCPILGIPLEVAKGIASDNSPSLDRIDTTKGYIKGNVIVISYRANRIKNDSSYEDIEKLYEWYKTLGKTCPDKTTP